MTISAKIIADSVSKYTGRRIVTLQLKYPRFIHSEFMTHRVFSRNASSSRAVPIAKVISMIESDVASPIEWGANRSGMSASTMVDDPDAAKKWWDQSAASAIELAKRGAALGLHKQIVNRILEPFSHIHVVATSTEFDNFFTLRISDKAQPEIRELAVAMRNAVEESSPRVLLNNEWHLPYISLKDVTTIPAGVGVPDLALVSAARCARVSYVKHDNTAPSLHDDLALAKMLLSDGHMSPFEHQAMATAGTTGSITGNFCFGFAQLRQMSGLKDRRDK